MDESIYQGQKEKEEQVEEEDEEEKEEEEEQPGRIVLMWYTKGQKQKYIWISIHKFDLNTFNPQLEQGDNNQSNHRATYAQ